MVRTMRRPSEARPTPDAMTLFEHLGELRSRLIVCLVGFVVGGGVTYGLYNPVYDALQHPYCTAVRELHRHNCSLFITQPLEGFTARLNVSAYGGLIIALPIIMWRFVTPGLKANERKYALPFVFATVLLFAAGGAVAYFIYPRALEFLIGSSGPHTTSILSPSSYIGLLGALVLIFGIAFEFPVVLVALELAGVITSAGLRSFRRWAILLITLFSAIITPSSDPFSMLALALPMVVFYEASILIGRLLKK